MAFGRSRPPVRRSGSPGPALPSSMWACAPISGRSVAWPVSISSSGLRPNLNFRPRSRPTIFFLLTKSSGRARSPKVALPLRRGFPPRPRCRRRCAAGVIDIVATHHAPHGGRERLAIPMPESARRFSRRADAAAPHAAHGRRRPAHLSRIGARLLRMLFAALFGLAGRKGTHAVGADADVAIVARRSFTIRNEDQQSRAGADAFRWLERAGDAGSSRAVAWQCRPCAMACPTAGRRDASLARRADQAGPLVFLRRSPAPSSA